MRKWDLGSSKETKLKLGILQKTTARIYVPQSDLELESIQLRNTGSHETIHIQLLQPEPKETSKTHTEEKIPYISQLMLQYGISYKFYHELSSIVKELP